MQLMMADRPQYYVSLGDSISIDAYAGGIGWGAASLLYRNRDSDFPEWIGRDLMGHLPGVRLIPLAMDGATSATVRYAQIPRLKEMNIRPALVTLTMGGNDLLQTFGKDEITRSAHRAFWDNCHAILAELRGMTDPNVPILVGTIYDPSDGTNDTAGLGLIPWNQGVEWIARFNATLRTIADEHGAWTADIHKHFLGHGIKVGDPTGYEPLPANQQLFYCSTIEPNAWGASAIRGVFWNMLTANHFFDGKVRDSKGGAG